MPVDALKALEHETQFLSTVEASFEAAKGKLLRGSTWQYARHDEQDRVRALMARERNYDRERLKSLPTNRRLTLHGYERRWLFGRRQTGVAIASVLSPLQDFARSSEEAGPPIGLADLTAHVRKLVGDARVPHLIGVCSPTGFTKEARQGKLDLPYVTVVLVEPKEPSGWRTTGSGDSVDPRVLKLFDPENDKEKAERIQRSIEDHSADLLTGSLTASSIANETNLPEFLVRRAFERTAEADPELLLTKKDGACVLFRGAPVSGRETKSMNMIDRLKQMFASAGDEAEKINILAERRATLAQRRDRLYDDIAKLEKKDADLVEQGKATSSAVPRRRLAAQLAQLRKDIGRQNATAAMLNQQIDIISTDIHNLTLIKQGEAAQLPESEELTEHAVQAEEMLETLQADRELVGSLEMGIEASLTSDEELAILREFEGADEAAKSPADASPKTASAAEPIDRANAKPEPVAPEPAPPVSEAVEEEPPQPIDPEPT